MFFMKAHIFAGQVQVDNEEIVDFAWVTKQEMENFVSKQYYAASIINMLIFIFNFIFMFTMIYIVFVQ